MCRYITCAVCFLAMSTQIIGFEPKSMNTLLIDEPNKMRQDILNDLAELILEPSPDVSIVFNSANDGLVEMIDGQLVTTPIGRNSQIGAFDFGVNDQNGIAIVGSLLPPDNQNPAGNASYNGSIGIQNGLCLCTGHMTAADYSAAEQAILDDFQDQELRVGQLPGLAGPNCGIGLQEFIPTNEGEISKQFSNCDDVNGLCFEVEFNAVVPESLNSSVERDNLRDAIEHGGDAASFEFELTTTRPGVFFVQFVYGSDEFPDWTRTFNDMGAIIFEEDGRNPVNLMTVRTQTQNGDTTSEPLTLLTMLTCPKAFIRNEVAPNPEIFRNGPAGVSNHVTTDTDGFYDIELSGFTRPMTRLTGDDPTTDPIECRVVKPGTHRFRIMVHDVSDTAVDAAIFVPAGGIRFEPVADADFNLDGVVDNQDFNIMVLNWQMFGDFSTGDANFDGFVDAADMNIFAMSEGDTGWAKPQLFDFDGNGTLDGSADFNFDGVVDGSDFNIWNDFFPMTSCATQHEGDSDGDADVDADDLQNWCVQAGLCP